MSQDNGKSPALSSRHLLGLEGVPADEITLILDTAEAMKEILDRPIKKVPTLRGVTVVNLFFEDSTRTKLSFELAEKRLSADLINFSKSGSSVAKGETLLDTARNIEAMKVDVVVVRHQHPGVPKFLADRLTSVVVNAGDGSHEHPTQALLDMMTLRQTFGHFKGLRVAIVGDITHSRVVKSNIHGLITMGAEVMLVGPPTLMPRDVESLNVKVSHDIDEAIAWADALNVLRLQLERQKSGFLPSLREYHMTFGVTLERLAKAPKELVILHPGPMNRGVEIESAVADSGASVILEQVTNGVAVRMAVLMLLSAPEGIL
ncbi:aspartate carbamoyltransferase catalytic subunit [bacterium]|nr:aspartate carbamoyltransferase catalytic subunit [bacterium]MBU1652499.1 aspartate carbamoyltransferase catalytic subunit [bacterium]